MSIATANQQTDGRYQLTSLKEQLAEALGDDGPSYWSALRDFVQGKLNRQEFDFYAYMYLTGEKASLHNEFILATIHNAQSGQAPPEGERDDGFDSSSTKKKKRKHQQLEGGNGENNDGKQTTTSTRSIKALLEDPKWRYVKELVKSLNKGERRAIKTLLKRPDITPEEAQEAIRAMKPVVLPLPASQLPQSYAMDIAKGITAPLIYDTKSTPDIDSLNYRMVALALEQGLSGGVTRDAGELLLYALDCHMKNIVSSVIYKTRSNRALGIPVSNSLVRHHHSSRNDELDNGDEKQMDDGARGESIKPLVAKRPTTGGLRLRDRLYHSKTTLRLSDLLFAFEICPNLTVEPTMSAERCGNLLATQLLAEQNEDDEEDSNHHGDDEMSHKQESSGTDAAGSVPEQRQSSKDDGNGSTAMDVVEDDENKQRRKVRRLQARYERWFGPYVSVNYSGGSNKN